MATSKVVRIPLTSPTLPSHSGSAAGAELLDDFILGEENALIAHVAQASETILQRGNPWLFVGPSGVGKSALAKYFANRHQAGEHPLRILHEPASEFARRYAEAVDADDIDRFRERYHGADLWLLEDVQQIAPKSAAQLEMNGRLDHCLEAGIPVIATSNNLPTRIADINAGLASRLLGGLTLSIAPPGVAARLVILEMLSKKLGLDLSEGELVDLESRLPPRIVARRLGSALQELLVRRTVAKEGLSGIHPGAPLNDVLIERREPTIASITTLVSKRLKVRTADLRGNTRRQSVVQARSLAMYLGRELTAASLQQIGKYFGGRDHSTVLHALKKAGEAVKNEPEMARLARELADQLRAG